MAAVVFAICAFKFGRKVVRHIRAVSADPISYGLSNMPSPKGNNKQATLQATTNQVDINQVDTNEMDTNEAINQATFNQVDTNEAIKDQATTNEPMSNEGSTNEVATHQPNPPTATATVTVTWRRTGPKAAPKPLQDYSLLAPPHIRQLEVDYWKKHQEEIAALKACRLQFADCRWYKQIYN
jgi:hypothetical protein